MSTLKRIYNDFQKSPLVYIVQIVGVLVVILNLWIASKLSPLSQNLAVITTRVNAVEEALVPRSEIIARLDGIDKRLENIEVSIFKK